MSIRRTAVIGVGTMGSGIAQSLAAAGCQVQCFDEVPAARQSLHDRIERNLVSMQAAGMLREEVASILNRIEIIESEDALAEAEFVIEAVAENLAIKQALFSWLERIVSAQAILASNTSSITLSAMTAHLKNQSHIVVAHWFNPAHLVPVVEVVPGPQTSEQTMLATIDLLQRAGKLPVRLKHELPGFIVNRVQVAMIREVISLLDQGIASAEEIDRAIRGTIGFRLAVAGPLEIVDLGGLDIWRKVFETLSPVISSAAGVPAVIERAVQASDLGVKTGRGIYDYDRVDTETVQARRDEKLLQLSKLLYSPPDAKNSDS